MKSWIYKQAYQLGFDVPDYYKLLSHKNQHKGKRAFIIGTGPSLQISDLEKLRNEITFASNKIFLAFEQTDWRPKYYSAFDIPCMADALEKLSPQDKTTCFFPSYFSPKNPRHIYFSLKGNQSCDTLPEFSEDISHHITGGYTITYALMQMAYFMGISQAYLLGVDFNYTIHKKDPVKHEGGHDYYANTGENNYFIENYHRPGELFTEVNIQGQYNSYLAARKFCETHDFSIYNATRGGQLDVFQRVNFDSLVAAHS